MVNRLLSLVLWVLVTRNLLFSGISVSKKLCLLVMRKQWGCVVCEYTVRQMKACFPWLLMYFWMVMMLSPSCCRDKLWRQREFTSFTSWPQLLGSFLLTSLFMVATSSFGEQKLVTFPTKSLREMLLLASTFSCALVQTQSSGCSLRLIMRVSGINSDAVSFARVSSFQKYAQGLSPSSGQLYWQELICCSRESIALCFSIRIVIADNLYNWNNKAKRHFGYIQNREFKDGSEIREHT